jgi:hypothetical protein
MRAFFGCKHALHPVSLVSNTNRRVHPPQSGEKGAKYGMGDSPEYCDVFVIVIWAC